MITPKKLRKTANFLRELNAAIDAEPIVENGPHLWRELFNLCFLAHELDDEADRMENYEAELIEADRW